jgi:hypothetical protein
VNESEYHFICLEHLVGPSNPKPLSASVTARSFRDARRRICHMFPSLVGKDTVILRRGKKAKGCGCYGSYTAAWRGKLGW